jgi:gamma-glutamyl hercynylcysteine S-oxide synthase
VNRGTSNATSTPLVFVPCTGASVFDLYAGVQLSPVAVPGSGGECAVSLGVEAGGFGAVLALDPADVSPALTTFLDQMASMTAAPLASFDTAPVLLQQNMTAWGTTSRASQPPPGMKAVAGATSWVFAVDGTEIEGGSTPGTDVSALVRTCQACQVCVSAH